MKNRNLTGSYSGYIARQFATSDRAVIATGDALGSPGRHCILYTKCQNYKTARHGMPRLHFCFRFWILSVHCVAAKIKNFLESVSHGKTN